MSGNEWWHQNTVETLMAFGFTQKQADNTVSSYRRDVESPLRAENERLRKVIAHLMTNPLDAREHACHTSDIDAQTGHVEITDEPGNRTTIRIAE